MKRSVFWCRFRHFFSVATQLIRPVPQTFGEARQRPGFLVRENVACAIRLTLVVSALFMGALSIAGQAAAQGAAQATEPSVEASPVERVGRHNARVPKPMAKPGQRNVIRTPRVRLPRGFVFLRDVAPSIRQEMRYASPFNFTGARVPGYDAAECVLARPVAAALARVQQSLCAQGLSLKVYDCYRPARSVRAFVRWAREGPATAKMQAYFPNLRKRQIIPRGYVAPRSTHSTGRAIDLTLVQGACNGSSDDDASAAGDPFGALRAATLERLTAPCTAPQSARAPDTSVDMGTGYDCFDVRSHTYADGIGVEAVHWREKLLREMRAEGFRNYAKEWWHFSLRAPGFERREDFPIVSGG